MGNGSDFELPEDILRVLPTDPYDQLDLARKITSIAIASRVSKLEAENGKLRNKLLEKDAMIGELQGNISQLDYALKESHDRLSHSVEQQALLANDKNALISTVKKLNRDVAKLEAFKKTLMQSLQEDDEVPQLETEENMIARRQAKSSFSSSSREEAVNGVSSIRAETETMETSSSNTEEENHTAFAASGRGGQRFSFTPYLTPRRTPTGTPTTTSSAGSPKRSPRRHSTAGSPKRQSEGRISSSLPPIHHATAPNSPPNKRSLPARTPRVDGKEFFRQARSRLSYEQFSAFLANIKELNSHQQSREETLLKADEIFGSDNKDLYLAFEGLLSRHLN